jgi:thiol:disulfide interchange protein DsbC
MDFKDLPLKDAFTIVRGNGKRKMALFSDPNCGFCKRFERDLLKINNVTVHVFLYPILGPDSIEKSRHIWCAKDKEKAYLDWMLNNVTPTAASCDDRRHRPQRGLRPPAAHQRHTGQLLH